MNGKIKLSEKEISRCLYENYELLVEHISFLPLGADFNTAVYQIISRDKTEYFLKIIKGSFYEAAV